MFLDWLKYTELNKQTLKILLRKDDGRLQVCKNVFENIGNWCGVGSKLGNGQYRWYARII